MTRKTVMLIAGGIITLGIIITVPPFILRHSKSDNASPIDSIHQKAKLESPKKANRSLRPPLRERRLSISETRAIDADPAGALRSDPNNLDLLVIWASRDPQAAMAWIKAGKHSMAYEQMLGAFATGILIEKGIGAMNRFVADHQNDEAIPPKNRGKLERNVFFNLGREDTIAAALSLLHGSDSTDLAGMMVLGVKGAQEQTRAIDYLATKGIPVSVSYWAFQESIDADPRYWADWADQRNSEMLTDIVQSWARQQPQAARDWIQQRIPMNDPRRKIIDDRLTP